MSDSSETTIQSLMELRSIDGSNSSPSDDEVLSARTDLINGEVCFRLGQVFASINDFYDVKSYGVRNMYGLRFVKKDKRRCRVKCVDNCPWHIFCSKIGNLETYKVKTFIDSHNCQKEEVRKKFANTKWLGNMVVEDLRNNRKMTAEELKSLIAEKYKVTTSTSKAYRIKAHVSELLDENIVQQYSRLANYCEELLRTNPGSTVELLAPKHDQNGPSRFDRIYICIDACRKGFLAGCRPLIALDGCHLTGYYRGQLLGAGLVYALNELYPSPYHRFCIRHLYSNFQKKWKNEQVRSLFWSAAKSTTRNSFDKHMDRMKDKEYSAWEYITRIGVERWSRAHFQDNVKCHVFSSSIIECFNGVMKKFRDNPIDILIDNIRIKTRHDPLRFDFFNL
ncbi:hypothetical protein C2S51_021203 [Perilla frutescens var. frutescens]|nr:hypothetical protein C2S51_021203 [Perilla frutescens var. frutescens]